MPSIPSPQSIHNDELSLNNADIIENLLVTLNEISMNHYIHRHQQNLERVGSIYSIAGCQDQL